MPNVSSQPAPLAELHCHLEGTVEPDHARRLAKRHGIDISKVLNAEGGYHWSTFEDFLHVYDAVSEVLRTPEDYFEITHAYYTRMAARGLIYGEVFVSPAHAGRFALSYATLIDAVASAMRAAENETGVVGRIVITCVRHYGVDHAVEVARAAAKHPHPYVTGFGMAGDEAQGRNADFAEVFAIARNAGLGLTAHAGEILGPESIRSALDHLHVQRLGHGVRVLEDDALVARLIEQNVTLEVCPTSNVAIGLYPSIESHPVRVLYDRGLAVTLNSDDPSFFGVDLADEARLVEKVHKFSGSALNEFTRTAIDAAFCDSKTATRLRERLKQN